MKKTFTSDRVKVLDDVMHYLPCSTSVARVRGWQEIKVFNGFQVEMRAWETINVFDIFLLIASVKYFQDHTEDIEQGQITKDRETVTVKMKLWEFAERYLHTHNYHAIEESLKRLSSFQAFYKQSNGDIKEQRYLLFFEVATVEAVQYLTVGLSKSFYDYCLKGLTLNFALLQSITTPTARLLYMYVAGQRNTAFYQPTLERALGLNGKDYDNRKRITTAFNELQKSGSIAQSWKKKTPKGWLFGYR